MQKRRLLGISLIVLGLALLLVKPLGITGAIIGLGSVRVAWFYVVGLGMIVGGMILQAGGLEDKLFYTDERGIVRVKDIYGILQHEEGIKSGEVAETVLTQLKQEHGQDHKEKGFFQKR